MPQHTKEEVITTLRDYLLQVNDPHQYADLLGAILVQLVLCARNAGADRESIKRTLADSSAFVVNKLYD